MPTSPLAAPAPSATLARTAVPTSTPMSLTRAMAPPLPAARGGRARAPLGRIRRRCRRSRPLAAEMPSHLYQHRAPTRTVGASQTVAGKPAGTRTMEWRSGGVVPPEESEEVLVRGLVAGAGPLRAVPDRS